MRTLLLLTLLPLAACGDFKIQNFREDLSAEALKDYATAKGPILEETFAFAPIFYFDVKSAKKFGEGVQAERFTQGPLLTYVAATNSQYDGNGKLLHTASWTSVVWDVLYSSYCRKYKTAEGTWQEDTHWGTLFGMFGVSTCSEGKYLFFLFFPITLG